MNIHLIGIGGTGMASLAGLLVESGHRVTGSDEGIYPPMSDQLARLGIAPFEGYCAANIEGANPEIAIIGNVIRRDNPEAQEVLRRGIKYHSMPSALADFFLKDRTPLVIAGTHGKTTVSTLTAWLLLSCKLTPGYLIGGIGINAGKSYSTGNDPFFVVEGDEYDTAFFDKGPKFLHYRPRGLLITSIEFDHADIYRDFDHLMDAFRRLVKILPPDGLIVANTDDKNVRSIVKAAECRVVSYGLDKNADYHPENIEISKMGTSFRLSNTDCEFTSPLWGEHNLSNVTGALSLLIESGQNATDLASGLAEFKGVKRRQEVVAELKGVTIVDDFAHHPTAARKTIESMRLRFPDRRLWAIFEPRSNSSRRNIFQREYESAFSGADRVIIASPYREAAIPRKERLDVDRLAIAILKNGTDAHAISSTDNILEFIMRGIDHGDVVLVMSNGTFDGLCQKLAGALEKRRIIADRKDIVPGKVPR